MAHSAPANQRYRILLTEASSASAREVLTVLGRQGHEVGVMDSGGISFTALSRWVKRRHKSPPFAADPLRYLAALREVLTRYSYDVLLPTHEQLAALARYREEFGRLVPGLAVPTFDAVRKVQDKAAAIRLFEALGLPQPDTALVRDEGGLIAECHRLPAYVKVPVATSSRGVWLAEDPAQLARIATEPAVRETFATGGEVLVQRQLPGRVVMVQALFNQGELAGVHAVLRRREGVQGSSSAKESVVLPDIVQHLTKLGAALTWHGPISLDAVLDEDFGLVHYIDVNPRLVEPVNAELAGADLVRRWLAVSCGQQPGPLPAARAGVRTHMLLMALVRHAETGRGRRAMVRELFQAITRRGGYAGSREELLPVGSDPAVALLLGALSACLLASPTLWRRLAGTDTPPHALTGRGWQQLISADVS
ncbi:hypothetical protein [Streptomyces zagrosensis]|uniref:Putative ATP-grasp superfamily ATP-dependent carboligase n=1 Tax=Streptomyces zagrosensis TaxID=1042984 RepID=A0A7W9UZ66_9ACTN|nr:hypothetical protein [Streptomyces zagrosensis]MBB5936678.1 putative ATP-grasp superfamily ATP-dependent carboligase [Streptomyces zagrosensis]